MRDSRGQDVLVVNQYYAPDLASTGQLAAEFCAGLARRGFAVRVVVGQPSYTAIPLEAPPSEVLDGVTVHRVPLGKSRGRVRMSARLAGYLRFLWRAWRKARALVKEQQPDRVMTFHNPPFVGLIGAYLAKRNGIPFTYVLYDIHPDVLIATKWINLPRPVLWLWEYLHSWIIRQAESIIFLGTGMKNTRVYGKGVPAEKVHVIPSWGRPELTPAASSNGVRSELGIADDDLLLVYAGNQGVMHPLEPILDAAATLLERPVRFLFVGDGAKNESITRRAHSESLTNVSFLPFQPEERFAEIIAASDACFVVLQPGLERVAVPSRAYTFLSAGKPLITLMVPEADIARLVVENECGWNVTTGPELADLIRRLVRTPDELVRRGETGRKVYDERFRREQVIAQYAKLLEA